MDNEKILEQLQWRYATKQFDPEKKLSDDQVSLLRETLRLAPSSFGLQPWRFIFVSDPEVRAKLREKAWNQSQATDASHFVVLCRPTTIGEDKVDQFLESVAKARGVGLDTLEGYGSVVKGFMKKFTDNDKANWMEKQIYLALGSLLTVCAMAKIDACPMEGFEHDEVDSILDLPKQGLASVVLCALGFRQDSDKYAGLAKVRYAARDVIADI